MSDSDIYICPGISGYQFTPSIPKVDARILSLLKPSPDEIQDSDSFVPMFRADWLRDTPRFLSPRQTIVILAGFRATAFRSDVQRGGGSVWAVARVLKVITTPSASFFEPHIESLTEKLSEAITASGAECPFANNRHIELRSSTASGELDRAFSRLRSFRERGFTVGPFQRKKLSESWFR